MSKNGGIRKRGKPLQLVMGIGGSETTDSLKSRNPEKEVYWGDGVIRMEGAREKDAEALRMARKAAIEDLKRKGY